VYFDSRIFALSWSCRYDNCGPEFDRDGAKKEKKRKRKREREKERKEKIPSVTRMKKK